MDIDELFGEGAQLGKDVIVKAQLRFRVHPPQHPVAQDIVDRLVSAYDERLDMICAEVEDVLRHADSRRADHRQPLVLALGLAGVRTFDVAKASQVYAPGAHGGKWYRDGKGHIRYGEKPSGGFKQRATSEHTGPHLGHMRPSPFNGMRGVDRDLTGYLMANGGKYGFEPNELRFLGAWYGTVTDSGALFDAFLACAGMSREDLKDDLTQLRFGKDLTYEEAVFEFFAAQRELFMGDEAEVEDGDAEWNSMLNDEIKPLLDSVFKKYEALKEDDKFKASYAKDGDNQRRRFFDNAKRCEAETSDLANDVLGEWDPEKQVAGVLTGMRRLGLFTCQARGARGAHVKDRPHLKDTAQLDDRLLVDDARSNPLIACGDKLCKLSASQLMLLYAAAELHRRWDPSTRSYSPEEQADVGPGSLGEATLSAIAKKSKRWASAITLVRGHLDDLVDRLVATLNHDNDGLDREPSERGRSKKARRGEP